MVGLLSIFIWFLCSSGGEPSKPCLGSLKEYQSCTTNLCGADSSMLGQEMQCCLGQAVLAATKATTGGT